MMLDDLGPALGSITAPVLVLAPAPEISVATRGRQSLPRSLQELGHTIPPMRFRPFSAFILAIGLAALTGCGGYGLQFTNSTPTTGTIRFINGAPSAASLDFLLSASAGNE